MDKEKRIHSSQLEVNGELFIIEIFSSDAGRFFAKTCLGEGDVIITDGASPHDVLRKHEDLLPLAVGTREITQSYLGLPVRGRRPRV